MKVETKKTSQETKVGQSYVTVVWMKRARRGKHVVQFSAHSA